jgi:hypothetical protein
MYQNVAQRLRVRHICRSLDEFTLATFADHDIEQAMVELVDDRLAHRSVGQDEVAVVIALPPGVRALYLTRMVETEVIDGGFVRYFRSWAGPLSEEAVAAFEFFSAHEHARLMREANRVYANELGAEERGASDGPESPDDYESSRLQVLEERFQQVDASLSALRIEKIRASPQEFCER